jgi:hypothetical protein
MAKVKDGTANGRNGHAKNRLYESDTLNDLLGGLDPVQRVEALHELYKATKDEKVKQEAAAKMVEEVLAKATQPKLSETAAKPVPEPPLEPPQPAPQPFHRSNGERTVVEGHGKDGRFIKGNQCAAGRSLNPHARRQAALRAIVAEVVDETRLRKIIDKLATNAEDGDLDAARFLCNYLLGRPGPAPDPDRLDLEEWLLANAQPTISEALRAFLDNVSAADATEFVQGHMEGGFKERVERREKSECVRQIVAMRDKRSGRKRKPSAPLGG